MSSQAVGPSPDPEVPDLPVPSDPAQLAELLVRGELSVLGRLVQASNATLLVRLELDGHAARAVYKPVRGERPLWDFPHGTLADREVAARVVCEALGWQTVPLTVARPTGPFGEGSVQLWVDEAEDGPLVDVVEPADLAEGWLVVLQAEGERGEPVLLVHRDEPELRRMALLDAVCNNADRKGGHVLRGTDGSVRGVDHGLTFNADDKLRTVLWGWAGEPLTLEERDALGALDEELAPDGPLAARLDPLLRTDEVARTRERVLELLEEGEMPDPSGRWPAIPWPAL
ncbi:SCO1664 family protein [Aquipuribacter hungaricus]|uniref:SCO1664 family protein n=1 Tax=Aquipuribacter hungaricus TaxID=545624 RepID=A0ABV7WCS0_9MICO